MKKILLTSISSLMLLGISFYGTNIALKNTSVVNANVEQPEDKTNLAEYKKSLNHQYFITNQIKDLNKKTNVEQELYDSLSYFVYFYLSNKVEFFSEDNTETDIFTKEQIIDNIIEIANKNNLEQTFIKKDDSVYLNKKILKPEYFDEINKYLEDGTISFEYISTLKIK